MADFTQGYEKVNVGSGKNDFPPFSSWGTEVNAEDTGPGPEWAKRPQKSDPHPAGGT